MFTPSAARRIPTVALLTIMLLIGIGSLGVTLTNWRTDQSPTTGVTYQPGPGRTNSLPSCIESTRQVLGMDHIEVALYYAVWQLCVSQLYSLNSLPDYDVRLEKFVRQGLDERIILWTVVTITLAGVCLAGRYLWISYKLVVAGFNMDPTTDSSLAIEHNKISVTSSTTGLLILAVSLAFFSVYVVWVYSAGDTKIHAAKVISSAAPQSAMGPSNRSIDSVGHNKLASATMQSSAAPAANGLGPPGAATNRIQFLGSLTAPPRQATK